MRHIIRYERRGKMEFNNNIANDLFKIGAVQIDTKNLFTWTSGIEAPIYCDNRLTMGYPAIRKKIAEGFVRLIKQMNEQPDVIAGCATAGIPHAAWIADQLELPLVYVRSKPKSHGQGKQIEGIIEEGQRVVVIEDLISTGKSSIASAKALEQVGSNVLAVLAIFTYGLQEAVDQFHDARLTYNTITNYDQLLSVLNEANKLNNKDFEQLLTWRSSL